MPQKKSVDIVGERRTERTRGLRFGTQCFSPSDGQGNAFCDGLEKGIDTAIKAFGLEPSDYQYECTTEKSDSGISKEMASLGEESKDVLRDTDAIVKKIDKKSKSVVEVKRFYLSAEKGEFDDDGCKFPSGLIPEKFCAGFNKGMDIVIKDAKADKTKIVSNCKPADNAILYGIRRLIG